MKDSSILKEKPTVKPEVGQNVIHITDFIIRNIDKDNDELTKKAKESLVRGLWLLGGLGLVILRNNFQEISIIVLSLFLLVVAVVVSLSLVYIFYFTRTISIQYPGYKEYHKNIIYEQDYAIVVAFYIKEISIVYDTLLEINENLSIGLKWINILSTALILLIGITVLAFFILYFFLQSPVL